MPKSFAAIVQSPLGKLAIRLEQNKLTELTFVADKHKIAVAKDAATQAIINQLENYFADSNYQFTADLNLIGTEFQCRVWQALTKIPAGTVTTYGELAKKLKSSPRAVGNACRNNPIAIIVPCHRVVAKASLGGYSGATSGKLMQLKRNLLQHEGMQLHD